MINPVSSLEGAGRLIGQIFPTAHFLVITRGVFSKALGYADLQKEFFALVLTIATLLALCTFFLKKQEA